ncbi:MAG: DNA (cytosine-5-)-methyltransferase [Fusobacterium necrophorum]|nr:DNA (cytosine-5-)-methyltransferase [Fusobacterium necrophorum]
MFPYFILEVITIEEIKVLELFGGIGAIRKAFIRQKIPHRIIDYVEVDKNCVKSYNALYGEDFKPQDIVKYHPPDERIDFVMHGSPCQDFSRSGLKKGGEKGSGTRSSLLFETIRIIEEMKEKPKVVIWENVKGVLDQNMRASFFHYLKEMERLGYESKYKILNAMDFGIPQNRKRIFVVSLLGQNDFDFEALKKVETRNIDDFLEKGVSDLYEVRQESMLRYLSGNPKNKNFKGRLKVIEKYAYTISTKQVRVPNSGLVDIGNGNYRYLTERECLRLMGFDDEDFDKIRAIYQKRPGKTSSILYKQAGNSIVVNVLEAILNEIYRR